MSSNLNADKIKTIIEDLGFDYRERPRTIFTTCPGCDQDDKLSILKDGGSTICYRGSCSFGGPRPFIEWVMLTKGCDRQQAINLVYGEPDQPIEQGGLKLNLSRPDKQGVREMLQPIPWPPPFALTLDKSDAAPGAGYLANRGVAPELAASYGITYDIASRRVVFPVVMNMFVYGWQARAIDPVAPGDRMRNNPGFQRARCVLFLDRLQPGKPAIIAEGPFDALKFHLCGGNVSTMGKNVSSEQLALILARRPSAIYLALDDDAAAEMRDVAKRVSIPVFRVRVPETAVERCRQVGKKADFGECTMEECMQAFRDAQPFGMLSTAIHLKNPWE